MAQTRKIGAKKHFSTTTVKRKTCPREKNTGNLAISSGGEIEKKLRVIPNSQARKAPVPSKKKVKKFKPADAEKIIVASKETIETPIIPIRSNKSKEEKEKNIHYYFENFQYFCGRKRYIDIAGGIDLEKKRDMVYAFDLLTEKAVAFREDDWYSRELRKEKISDEKYRALIKRRNKFLNS